MGAKDIQKELNKLAMVSNYLESFHSSADTTDSDKNSITQERDAIKKMGDYLATLPHVTKGQYDCLIEQMEAYNKKIEDSISSKEAELNRIGNLPNKNDKKNQEDYKKIQRELGQAKAQLARIKKTNQTIKEKISSDKIIGGKDASIKNIDNQVNKLQQTLKDIEKELQQGDMTFEQLVEQHGIKNMLPKRKYSAPNKKVAQRTAARNEAQSWAKKLIEEKEKTGKQASDLIRQTQKRMKTLQSHSLHNGDAAVISSFINYQELKSAVEANNIAIKTVEEIQEAIKKDEQFYIDTEYGNAKDFAGGKIPLATVSFMKRRHAETFVADYGEKKTSYRGKEMSLTAASLLSAMNNRDEKGKLIKSALELRKEFLNWNDKEDSSSTVELSNITTDKDNKIFIPAIKARLKNAEQALEILNKMGVNNDTSVAGASIAYADTPKLRDFFNGTTKVFNDKSNDIDIRELALSQITGKKDDGTFTDKEMEILYSALTYTKGFGLQKILSYITGEEDENAHNAEADNQSVKTVLNFLKGNPNYLPNIMKYALKKAKDLGISSTYFTGKGYALTDEFYSLLSSSAISFAKGGKIPSAQNVTSEQQKEFLTNQKRGEAIAKQIISEIEAEHPETAESLKGKNLLKRVELMGFNEAEAASMIHSGQNGESVQMGTLQGAVEFAKKHNCVLLHQWSEDGTTLRLGFVPKFAADAGKVDMEHAFKVDMVAPNAQNKVGKYINPLDIIESDGQYKFTDENARQWGQMGKIFGSDKWLAEQVDAEYQDMEAYEKNVASVSSTLQSIYRKPAETAPADLRPQEKSDSNWDKQATSTKQMEAWKTKAQLKNTVQDFYYRNQDIINEWRQEQAKRNKPKTFVTVDKNGAYNKQEEQDFINAFNVLMSPDENKPELMKKLSDFSRALITDDRFSNWRQQVTTFRDTTGGLNYGDIPINAFGKGTIAFGNVINSTNPFLALGAHANEAYYKVARTPDLLTTREELLKDTANYGKVYEEWYDDGLFPENQGERTDTLLRKGLAVTQKEWEDAVAKYNAKKRRKSDHKILADLSDKLFLSPAAIKQMKFRGDDKTVTIDTLEDIKNEKLKALIEALIEKKRTELQAQGKELGDEFEIDLSQLDLSEITGEITNKFKLDNEVGYEQKFDKFLMTKDGGKIVLSQKGKIGQASKKVTTGSSVRATSIAPKNERDYAEILTMLGEAKGLTKEQLKDISYITLQDEQDKMADPRKSAGILERQFNSIMIAAKEAGLSLEEVYETLQDTIFEKMFVIGENGKLRINSIYNNAEGYLYEINGEMKSILGDTPEEKSKTIYDTLFGDKGLAHIKNKLKAKGVNVNDAVIADRISPMYEPYFFQGRGSESEERVDIGSTWHLSRRAQEFLKRDTDLFVAGVEEEDKKRAQMVVGAIIDSMIPQTRDAKRAQAELQELGASFDSLTKKGLKKTGKKSITFVGGPVDKNDPANQNLISLQDVEERIIREKGTSKVSEEEYRNYAMAVARERREQLASQDETYKDADFYLQTGVKGAKSLQNSVIRLADIAPIIKDGKVMPSVTDKLYTPIFKAVKELANAQTDSERESATEKLYETGYKLQLAIKETTNKDSELYKRAFKPATSSSAWSKTTGMNEWYQQQAKQGAVYRNKEDLRENLLTTTEYKTDDEIRADRISNIRGLSFYYRNWNKKPRSIGGIKVADMENVSSFAGKNDEEIATIEKELIGRILAVMAKDVNKVLPAFFLREPSLLPRQVASTGIGVHDAVERGEVLVPPEVATLEKMDWDGDIAASRSIYQALVSVSANKEEFDKNMAIYNDFAKKQKAARDFAQQSFNATEKKDNLGLEELQKELTELEAKKAQIEKKEYEEKKASLTQQINKIEERRKQAAAFIADQNAQNALGITQGIQFEYVGAASYTDTNQRQLREAYLKSLGDKATTSDYAVSDILLGAGVSLFEQDSISSKKMIEHWMSKGKNTEEINKMLEDFRTGNFNIDEDFLNVDEVVKIMGYIRSFRNDVYKAWQDSGIIETNKEGAFLGFTKEGAGFINKRYKGFAKELANNRELQDIVNAEHGDPNRGKRTTGNPDKLPTSTDLAKRQKEEQHAIEATNIILDEHATLLEKAAALEQLKGKISTELADKQEKEAQAIKDSTDALREHEKVYKDFDEFAANSDFLSQDPGSFERMRIRKVEIGNKHYYEELDENGNATGDKVYSLTELSGMLNQFNNPEYANQAADIEAQLAAGKSAKEIQEAYDKAHYKGAYEKMAISMRGASRGNILHELIDEMASDDSKKSIDDWLSGNTLSEFMARDKFQERTQGDREYISSLGLDVNSFVDEEKAIRNYLLSLKEAGLELTQVSEEPLGMMVKVLVDGEERILKIAGTLDQVLLSQTGGLLISDNKTFNVDGKQAFQLMGQAMLLKANAQQLVDGDRLTQEQADTLNLAVQKVIAQIDKNGGVKLLEAIGMSPELFAKLSAFAMQGGTLTPEQKGIMGSVGGALGSSGVIASNKAFTQAQKDYLKKYQQIQKIDEEIARIESRYGNVQGQKAREKYALLNAEKASKDRIMATMPSFDPNKVDEEGKHSLGEFKFANEEEFQAFYQKILGFDDKHRVKLDQINLASRQNVSFIESIANGFKQSFRNLTDYSLAYAIIGKIRQAFSQIMQYTKQLNASMVDLQIASGESYESIKNMMLDFNVLAEKVGKSTQEVAVAANDWLRAGYTGNQAASLTESSMQLATLGMINSSQATSYLISVLKGWKLEASEVQSVVDKLTAVDMAAA